jgi:hypothetical protein
LREKSRSFCGDACGNSAARRQKADDLRQGVSERGRRGALRQTESSGNPAERSRAEGAFDLPGGDRSRVRTTEPRSDLRGQAPGFKLIEEPAQASWGGRDQGQDFFDKHPGVGAEPETARQVVDQIVERRHVFLPEGCARKSSFAEDNDRSMAPETTIGKQTAARGRATAPSSMRRLPSRSKERIVYVVRLDAARDRAFGSLVGGQY